MHVTLIKQVHVTFSTASFTHDVWFRLDLDLPFAPFVGLEIRDARTDLEACVDEVVYDTGTQRFTCYVDSDTELYERARENGVSVGEMSDYQRTRLLAIIEMYVAQGWKVDRQ